MPRKKTIKTTKKNPTNKKQEWNQKFLKPMKIREILLKNSIKECKTKLKQLKTLNPKKRKHLIAEKIESIAVFTRYLTFYPTDLEATQHKTMIQSLFKQLQEKKRNLSTKQYAQFLIEHLNNTLKTTQRKIKTYS